ncbi:MAG: hypothetical protein H6711_22135 [Myxococcales bacterium]|nr:hypothetical protein [Myxococcales bacterium]
MSRLRPIRGRRSRHLRAQQQAGAGYDDRFVDEPQARRPVGPDVGWDRSAPAPVDVGYRDDGSNSPLQPQILSLLADPRVDAITVDAAARALACPRADVETVIEAMRAAGTLVAIPGPIPRYAVPLEVKEDLEREFIEAADELGEHALLARISNETALATFDDEEPRLPATAGLLSLFLPGTGQLLNGDIGRASLVFAVWSIAWIVPQLSPVWTFVCLYAGAEAFFTAKIRSMERKMAAEAQAGGGAAPPKKLPSPRMT